MNKKVILGSAIGFSVIFVAIILFLIFVLPEKAREEQENYTDETTELRYEESTNVEEPSDVVDEPETIGSEDLDVTVSNENETENTSNENNNEPLEGAVKMPDSEKDIQRKEDAKFNTEMSNEELQERLSGNYKEIKWTGINLTEQQFKEWLTLVVPNYLPEYLYIGNFDSEKREVRLDVIETEDTAKIIEEELTKVLTDAIAHSELYDSNYKIIIKSVL